MRFSPKDKNNSVELHTTLGYKVNKQNAKWKIENRNRRELAEEVVVVVVDMVAV